MTPSRTDFSFHFIGDDSDPSTPVVDSYQHIIRWFEGESSQDKKLIKYLDKIETYIEPLIKN